MTGYCECGCGQETKITAVTDSRRGVVKGQPRHFVKGHNGRRPVVKNYRMVTTEAGQKLAHRLRAERALGRPLPATAVVHHADGSKSENAPLVICENRGYHMFIHARMRVKAAGGNPNSDAICSKCRQVKPLESFCRGPMGPSRHAPTCRACMSVYSRNHYLVKTGQVK